jgi:muramoyltetrapeptide carboxypeptidase
MGFYGPMLTSNLSNGEPYSQSELFGLLRGSKAFPHVVPNRDPYFTYRDGVAEGRLIGGNLSLLTALCGTPYQPDTREHILFIEDWKECYYTLDRQFQQLRMAGLFDHVRGVILCDFSQIETESDWPLPDFLKSLTDFLKVPVGYGFSVGHGEETATLPIGCMARFDAATGQLTLLESPTA